MATPRNFSPSQSCRLPQTAPHSVCAFSTIDWNTGTRSPGELLMTCNTSAVAVCCSNASRVSVMSRAFSIAMTACAAKFWSNVICLSLNGRTSLRYMTKTPSRASSLRNATHSAVRAPVNYTNFRREDTPER
jgi:hypothetical protein